MPYPSLEQYNDALQYPNLTLVDPSLKKGSIAKTGLGLPLALCGGFALTYTLSLDGKKIAIRCFHKESPNLQQRYYAISNKLKQLNSPYFVDFIYQPEGILVNSRKYPIVKMAWAEGITLGEFIENNYNNRIKIASLRKALRTMGSFLDQNKVAHGDIQPGNVMVSSEGTTVKLIDYDGMFVEEIKPLGSSELGHRNFQHPKRNESIWDTTLDRYSLIVLNSALNALEEAPELWHQTNSDGDAFLFRANDFNDPGHSKTFSLVSKYPKLTEDIRNLAAISRAKFHEIPTLEDFLQKKNIPQITITISSSSEFSRLPYNSPYIVLDATKYEKCQYYVGDRVELIGQIVDVKNDISRRGTPYIFINFGDWRGEIVKITIWSEGLEKLREKPDEGWVGKWISVVGLIEPPYHSDQYGYTHLSITITQPNQMHIIDEPEAKYRLGITSNTRTMKRNTDVLADMKQVSRPIGSNRPYAQNTVTSNQTIVDQMKRASTQPVGQQKTSQQKPITTTYSKPAYPKQKKEKKLPTEVIIALIFVGCYLLLLLYFLYT